MPLDRISATFMLSYVDHRGGRAECLMTSRKQTNSSLAVAFIRANRDSLEGGGGEKTVMRYSRWAWPKSRSKSVHPKLE